MYYMEILYNLKEGMTGYQTLFRPGHPGNELQYGTLELLTLYNACEYYSYKDIRQQVRLRAQSSDAPRLDWFCE